MNPDRLSDLWRNYSTGSLGDTGAIPPFACY